MNWAWYAIRGRFFPNSWSTIQLISVLNHIGWIVLFTSIFSRRDVVSVIIGLGPISMWIFLNLMLTGIYLMYAPEIEAPATDAQK